MIADGLAACRSQGLGWAAVLGEPGYDAAVRVPPRTESGLSDEYGGGSAFQVLELIPGRLLGGTGRRDAAEFASLS